MAAGGRRSGRLFFIFAIALVLILGVVIFLFKDQLFPAPQATPTGEQNPGEPVATPQPSGTIRTIEVVVLAQPVGLGSKITPEMLTKVKLLEEDYYPELYYPVSDVEGEEYNAVVGKYARYPLKEKVVLTQGMLSDTPVGSFAANLVPNGYVAIPIPISRLTAVSYALEPGDHVNVIASILLVDVDTSFQSVLPNTTGVVSETFPAPEGGGTIQYSVTVSGGGPMQGRMETESSVGKTIYVIPSETQRSRLVSQTLIQDVTILWVGDFPGPGIDLTETYGKPLVTTTTDAEGNTTTTTPPLPTVITLIVTPQDAVTINYLLLSGARLNLVLRSAGDTQRVQTEAVTLQFLMDQYRIPYPTKLPYSLNPRVDSLYYPDEIVPTVPIN
jgi:Flp pilus assembly protein CpaB